MLDSAPTAASAQSGSAVPDIAADGSWTIHTDVFDGPLDLLLYLVRRDGIDITRLRIAEICDAYLAYLDKLKQLRLEVAADYLVMAATLVHLKSLSLLPRPPTPTTEDGEPEEDPTEALARQLEAYQKVRARAEALEDRPWLGREVFGREASEMDLADRPIAAGIDAFGLLDLYWELLSKHAAGPPTHTLPDDGPDLRACCEAVISHIEDNDGRGELGVVLQSLTEPGERVVAFVATLEMVRLQWLGLDQEEHLAPVVLWFKDRDAIDLDMLTGAIVGEEDEDEDDIEDLMGDPE